MAGVLKGEVRWCDFGNQLGNELAGHRCALVLSNDAFNRANPLAIVAPTTRTPPGRASHWYAYLGATASWASLRQVKTVPAQNLRGIVGRASSQELAYAVGQIERLVLEPSGDPASGCVPGSVWSANVPYLRGIYAGTSAGALTLLLDYNGGNQMAVVVLFAPDVRRPSAVAIPVDGGPVVGQRVVLAHQVRSLYVPGRLGGFRGLVSAADFEAVGAAFLSIIS